MRNGSTIAVIIPAFNEEPSIGKVIDAIPEWIDDIVVVDNGSTDATAGVARSHGARVVAEPQRGYGSACLAGIAALESPDVVVFLDADFSDYPEEMALLVDPIVDDRADMVIGSRTIGQREPGALTPQALFGNWLACTLIRWFWKVSYTDLGPFRAIRHDSLRRLGMRDRTYGWTVEMQIKAVRGPIRVIEAPIGYRRRIGKSKISGTVKGVLGAGTKILATIFSEAFRPGLPERLIVFTRYPKAGVTKTRLIPALGAAGAAELQRRMTEHAIGRARVFGRQRTATVEVCYEGARRRRMARWLGPGLAYRQQGGGDIGERMAHSFREAFSEGAERVVIVGTDCPGITSALLDDAFDALTRNDVVFGPANDGGYYLIGLKTDVPELFVDVPWSTDNVLSRTLEIVRELGLNVAMVASLDDVDRPEDLPAWEREAAASAAAAAAAMKVSVIIPTLNEAAVIAPTLAGAHSATGVEVIVVDGGSTDDTANIARAAGATVLTCAPGRGRQMNCGARAATGDALVFVHADTRLPERFDEHVRATLARPDVAAGAFELAIDAPQRGLRFVERIANWRSRHLAKPYGDQCLFLGAALFRRVGGFPEIPIMDDFEMVRRLQRSGRIEIVPVPATASARRWQRLGVWRTTLINQAIIMGYYAGVTPARLAHWYDRENRRP
jgi:rSAM/selenodomain-associated transferase 2/rSAM/selenodomain-associated transferase 1